MPEYNAVVVGAGLNELVAAADPARTQTGAQLYLSSAATPPGGGVHGLYGVHAARAALADISIA